MCRRTNEPKTTFKGRKYHYCIFSIQIKAFAFTQKNGQLGTKIIVISVKCCTTLYLQVKPDCCRCFHIVTKFSQVFLIILISDCVIGRVFFKVRLILRTCLLQVFVCKSEYVVLERFHEFYRQIKSYLFNRYTQWDRTFASIQIYLVISLLV